MRRLVLFALLSASLGARAQDVLSLGSGSAQVPVSIAKVTANPVQGVAFKVLFDASVVASASFARTGAFASATPLYETSMQGSGWFSYVVLFPSSTNVSGQLGTLSVTFQPTAAPGTTVTLLLDPPSAMLSNQSASVVETVADGNLSLVNGSITVGNTPTSLVATAAGTTQVNLTWNGVAGASSYEVWRSVDGSAFALAGNPATTSFSDLSVVAGKTYLYRVRAGTTSPFSNTDAATTIVFTDDPLVAQSTIIKALHLTQLRTAVNAMRASASLGPLAADSTIGVGQVVRAQHITALRTALDQARAAIGLPALAYTDATPTIVKAAHVQELRSGVK
jgi:hypothetical protein